MYKDAFSKILQRATKPNGAYDDKQLPNQQNQTLPPSGNWVSSTAPAKQNSIVLSQV